MLSRTGAVVPSGTRSSCYRGPTQRLTAALISRIRARNFPNQESFGFLLTHPPARIVCAKANIANWNIPHAGQRARNHQEATFSIGWNPTREDPIPNINCHADQLTRPRRESGTGARRLIVVQFRLSTARRPSRDLPSLSTDGAASIRRACGICRQRSFRQPRPARTSAAEPWLTSAQLLPGGHHRPGAREIWRLP